MYWMDALEAAKEVGISCGLLPSVMPEGQKSEVLLVLNQRGTACYLTTLDGGWPDGSRPHGDRPLIVLLCEVDRTLHRFHLPSSGWR